MNRKMKLSAVALALATVGVSALAQDAVVVYGVIDAGVRAASNQAAPGSTALVPLSGTRTNVVSGGLTTSRIGFRGTEDLGGGLKAEFQLEGGLNIANGTTDVQNVLFNRVSHVGVRFGSNALYLGREYSETYLSLQEVDPLSFRAPSLNTNLQVGGLNDTQSWGNNLAGQSVARTSSAVRYDGNYGKLKTGVQYSFGGVADDSTASSSYGLRVSYDFGTVLVSGSASRFHDSASNELDAYSLGAKWKLSNVWSVAATYAESDISGGALSGFERRVGSVGAYYTPAGRMSVGVAYYGTRGENLAGTAGNNGAEDKLVGIASYSLSKRTSLYGTMDYSHVRDAMVPALTGKSNVLGGTIGVNHSF